MKMEQSLGLFLVSAVLISLSGVLSPGPMTAAVVERGRRSGLSGLYISLGHGLVEFPLIALLALGAGAFFQNEWTKVVVGVAGGAYLLYLGFGMLRPSAAGDPAEEGSGHGSSVVSGVLLSVGNPYFLLWWATVGLGLVISASAFGVLGVVLFAFVHWLCDLVWLGFLAAAANRGARRFGRGFYRKVSLVSGAVLVFFGGVFFWNSIRLLAGA
ncbi:MAG: LysE family transporter [Nitrospirota bacterium]|jgi:threonine/homoserine/homoserine lactone efflux protein